MKNTLLAALLVSSGAMANQPFQDAFFNNSVWSNFNKQFQQFNNEVRATQNQSMFGAQTKRFFDRQSNRYMIEVEVNGLAKENLDITSKDGMIHINGNVQKTERTNNSSRTSSSKFSQSYSLPVDADTNNINAEFKDNCLIISIPKLAKITPLVNKITVY
ncbi:Hsp20/alpha crystallin family protein [Candidatus Thioglobus sp.]|jgi:HSP20 family protein|uniref:Hsp20/alpha crystallin family protein n=1 Tax=Candidatus Thioglobus sp. TaxID=2026721 RepID=UPI001D836120|nr:Hsp20/alpha crystallin family protein [Candidatus Thioglobus sp.]MBT3276647.1 Hsp20/alpha crystallin family protein [Candidatus Thioglobus sp.]MBT3446499.1 Hsp20/alpha crystallin family protein [Candidatus Thioglobus sp.]MBT3745207.1 Hsp20/alpha crystallin family protein [Candidatus Thioglobus sp.]MBT4001647.1 Hsp20/alpha crystallin family protein [Candidatus Thioglobus sp.]MBT4181325.1 Hsp20/alpha crystallin family protein [Candidatus Thioglobus sp.]